MTDPVRVASVRGAGYRGGDGLDALLEATGRGEQGAFDLLYEQLSGPVSGVIRAVLRDRAQAEEVTQEVFLEIWRLASRYDPAKGTATAWVMTIARRRAIDRVRSAAAATAREERDAPIPSLDQVAEDAVQRELLRRCLSSLSGPQREAIMLSFYDGYTYLQVADVLGVPLGTVKTRIRDGLAKLREAMVDGTVAPSGLRHAAIPGLGEAGPAGPRGPGCY